MSTLRQVKKDAPPPAEDVEAPKPSPPKPAAAFAAASASDSAPAGPSGNPVFLAKVILRKVFTLLVESDEEDLTQPGGIVTLLKDIILGVILGVLTISVLIFLDHRDIVHFQSAHNFRNAAFQLLNDPETIATLEESSEMKFMTLTEYESKRKEIDTVEEKLKNHGEILEKRVKEADDKRKQLEEMRPEYEKLYGNPLLKLDKFCGSCHWGMKTSCEGRVQFLKDTYNTKPIQAIISAMGHESCVSK